MPLHLHKWSPGKIRPDRRIGRIVFVAAHAVTIKPGNAAFVLVSKPHVAIGVLRDAGDFPNEISPTPSTSENLTGLSWAASGAGIQQLTSPIKTGSKTRVIIANGTGHKKSISRGNVKPVSNKNTAQ